MNKIITVDRLKQLLESEAELEMLNCAGVDNWQWYGEALHPEDGESIHDFEPDISGYPDATTEEFHYLQT